MTRCLNVQYCQSSAAVAARCSDTSSTRVCYSQASDGGDIGIGAHASASFASSTPAKHESYSVILYSQVLSQLLGTMCGARGTFHDRSTHHGPAFLRNTKRYLVFLPAVSGAFLRASGPRTQFVLCRYTSNELQNPVIRSYGTTWGSINYTRIYRSRIAGNAAFGAFLNIVPTSFGQV